MKIFSIVLTVILIIALVNSSPFIYNDFRILKANGFTIEKLKLIENPETVVFLMCLIASAASIFLNFKKKYLSSCIISGIMIIVYIIVPFFMDHNG